MNAPKRLSRWIARSNSKGPYTVLYVTNLASINLEHPPQVVYQGLNGNVWSRSLITWYEKMKEVV